MSEVKTNKLTGTSTAGSILVTGEGNSTTTSLQQGLAKCWSVVDQTGTMELLDSFNASGISDDGTGRTTVSFTSAFSNANYSVPTSCEQGSGFNDSRVTNKDSTTSRATGSYPFFVLNVEVGSTLDVDQVNLAFFGDLA